MTTFVRKLVIAMALLVVGGLTIGGTVALAGDSSPSGGVATVSSSPNPSGDDDGMPDQGPGDFPAEADDEIADDDDGTPDQGPGDFPADDDDGDDRDDDGDDRDDDGDDRDDDGDDRDDDNSGPSENSGPGNAEDGDDSGHGDSGSN